MLTEVSEYGDHNFPSYARSQSTVSDLSRDKDICDQPTTTIDFQDKKFQIPS